MEPARTRPPRVVLYVDDSKEWHSIARLLGELARSTGAHVTILSSLLLPGSRQRALDQAKDVLALPDDRITLIGRPGLIEFTLPDTAREVDADLVVVGRLGSADRLTSGLIAHLIARRTPASVLIARGKLDAIRHILVCTEGTRHGLVDYERAVEIATIFRARVDVLHVVSQMGLTDKGQEEIEEDLRDFLHSDAPEAAHLRELEARGRALGLGGNILVRTGLVVEQIVDVLEEGRHDLLIIGAHEFGGPGGHLYEDFASLILRASPVSTLVVRDRLRRLEPE